MNDIPGWPWRPDLCPADLHYGEYLATNWHPVWSRPDGVDPKVIHVGTGLHHHVGLLLGSAHWTVIGLTISKEEFSAWARLTNRPESYICTIRDIRDPAYVSVGEAAADSMSLFHLGEPPAPEPWALSEREVIERALTWSREVVFYTGSAAWPKVAPVVYGLVDAGSMEHVATHKTLEAFRPTHG